MYPCAVNGLAFVIRSHEMVKRGYLVHHNRKLFTLFSASDYCGHCNNLGAVARLRYGVEAPEFTTFYVAGAHRDPEDVRDRKFERRVLGMLIERVCAKKAELFWQFRCLDVEQTGCISMAQWREVMRAGLQIREMPYFRVAQLMLEDDDFGPGDTIQYMRFLGRYHIVNRYGGNWELKVIQRICHRLFEITRNVRGAWTYFDTSRDGVIHAEEFAHGLRALDVGLTERQVGVLIVA